MPRQTNSSCKPCLKPVFKLSSFFDMHLLLTQTGCPDMHTHTVSCCVTSPPVQCHSALSWFLQQRTMEIKWFLQAGRPFCRPTNGIKIRAVKHLIFRHTNRSNEFFESHVNRILIHIVKYRDTLSWAVRKWLNRSRCSLECWAGWVCGTYYIWM